MGLSEVNHGSSSLIEVPNTGVWEPCGPGCSVVLDSEMGGRAVLDDWPKGPGFSKFMIGDWNKMTSDCVEVDSLSLALWALGKPSE